MAMRVPVPHYEMCVENFLKSEKKMCRSPPPPPPLSDFFRAGAKFYDIFVILPPLSKHPGAAPAVG